MYLRTFCNPKFPESSLNPLSRWSVFWQHVVCFIFNVGFMFFCFYCFLHSFGFPEGFCTDCPPWIPGSVPSQMQVDSFLTREKHQIRYSPSLHNMPSDHRNHGRNYKANPLFSSFTSALPIPVVPRDFHYSGKRQAYGSLARGRSMRPKFILEMLRSDQSPSLAGWRGRFCA